MPEDVVGQVLNGTYEIIRAIGDGGMGVVYEAVHTRLRQKRFAIKMLRPELLQSPSLYKRFQREAEVATEIGHPGIVEVVDFNTSEEGTPYLVMEYLEGQDLESRLQQSGPLSAEDAVAVIEQVASALHAAHQLGIVHRDLKPGNVFLVKDEREEIRVKLLDFGVAKLVTAATQLTKINSLIGTADFMSPEQLQGDPDHIDHRTDIFALGALFYTLVTGGPPFRGTALAEMLNKILSESPAPLAHSGAQVPAAWDAIILRAMAKDKAERYQSAPELAAALCDALLAETGRPATARPVAAPAEHPMRTERVRSMDPISTAETQVDEGHTVAPTVIKEARDPASVPRPGFPRGLLAAALVTTILAAGAAAIWAVLGQQTPAATGHDGGTVVRGPARRDARRASSDAGGTPDRSASREDIGKAVLVDAGLSPAEDLQLETQDPHAVKVRTKRPARKDRRAKPDPQKRRDLLE